MRVHPLIPVTLSLLCACGGATPPDRATEARAFVDRYEREFRPLAATSVEAHWDLATNLTDDNQARAASAYEKVLAYMAEAAREAARFVGLDLPPDVDRQITLIRRAGPLSAPKDPERRAELARISGEMASRYGKAKVCQAERCQDLHVLAEVLAGSRDPDELERIWIGWRDATADIAPLFERFVELANEGAREIGFADLGEKWRSWYDMEPAALQAEVERLWQQVRPLYRALHCHVRAKLVELYGADRVPPEGRIPAHLLANMWSQNWSGLYPELAPYPDAPSVDVSAALVAQGYTPRRMVEVGERFFVSLGLDKLPPTFWERSLFEKPTDREVICHASAWDVGNRDDLRVKMCIRPRMEDLVVIHHELGHNYYFHYYYQLPIILQNGAHDGFHEGIGDTLALSVTPNYLETLGLLESVAEGPRGVLNKQMLDALDRIAFLPFGLLVDRWRWAVFAGEVPREGWNDLWWSLRRRYQGVEPPVPRGPERLDPVAKYHIPSNTPYLRYFLSAILQFQFHEALCEAAGHQGPLHTCSIYGSRAAGERLRKMLAMGASRPWQDAMEVIAGTRRMDGRALLTYFEPLSAWLAEQNAGRSCGWPAE